MRVLRVALIKNSPHDLYIMTKAEAMEESMVVEIVKEVVEEIVEVVEEIVEVNKEILEVVDRGGGGRD